MQNFLKPLKPVLLASLTLLTVSASGATYPNVILGDAPRAYYRLNDDTTRTPINKNIGTLGAAGNATNNLSVVHPFTGALAGDRNRAEFFDFSSRTEIPWQAALNPPNTQPFTVEAWFYPASDQTATGQSPLANRFAWSGVNRQGWVFFQRKPDETYLGGEPVGWNFRMYNENAGNGALDVTSLVPYRLGEWTHVVVVYDPLSVSNATVTMYINGVAANTNIWNGGGTGTAPGYVANSNDHPEAPANLAIGNYNNTAGATLNPYFGAIDEFALYSIKLTPAQILSHYQNATNANRATPYQTLIQSHNPVAYLRLDEIAPGADRVINMGDVRFTGNATNAAEVRHPATSAIASRKDDGSSAYHHRNGTSISVTDLPWLAANNPEATVPFTIEGWFRPTSDRINPGAAVINNRLSSGAVNRTGWVIFQRAPNNTYSSQGGYEGVGWNLRMYQGTGGSSSDVVSDVPYTVGQWQHVVATWDGSTTITMYINGQAVASNTAALYAANSNPPLAPDEALAPVDLAVGAYNRASGFGSNPYEGDVDEVALYNNYLLTPEQILAHYQAGTNALAGGTNYETLVFTAPFTGPERQGPATYLHFNDPAHYPAVNNGTVGYLADGNLILTTNTAAGPQSPTFPGFEASNPALPLDGSKQWASFNNPSGLNIAGQITLETWIKPSAVQADPARIISHGPQTVSEYLGASLDDAVTNSSEVFLRIDSTSYLCGSAVFTNGIGTTYYYANGVIPGGDLGGGNWIHLVGTYDGANWRIYRNGVQLAIAAHPVGAVAVNNGDWAVGATGNGWANNFAGSVDEVAIYHYALSASQVAAHYAAATTAQPQLTITKTGGTVNISWPYGTLQQATLVTGPWTNVPSATSPYSTSATGTRFYRAVVPILLP